MTRLAAFLQIRSGEAQLAGFVAALFALIEAGRGLGGNAADALFYTRFGVEYLPYMFMLLGAANFTVALAYAASLGKFDQRRFFVLILIALAVVILIERAAIALDVPALYPVLWISINIISSIIGLLSWNIAGAVCDARQAKRLFAIFVSAGILGSVIGNFITGPLAEILGTQNLLILYAAVLFVCAGLARSIIGRFFKPIARRGEATSFIVEIRAGFDYVRASSMFKLMAVGSVLFSILYFSISFPFSTAVSASFPTEAEVAGFLGVFSGIATAITFFVSLFAASRLYARIGVVNAVLLLPIAYLIGFVLFALNFSLMNASAARLLQLVILGGIAGTAYSTFFNVVPSDKRGQVRSFDSGVPEQIGVALSGVLLILGQRVLTTTQIFIMGMLGSIVCGALVWRLRRSYGQALLDALRAGRVDVFTTGERVFAGVQGDANAIRTVTAALRDPKPSTRRIALELLARLHVRTAAPAVVPLLHDPERDVRLAAIRTLGDFQASETASSIITLLKDGDTKIRAAALQVLPDMFPPVTRPLIETIAGLLSNNEIDVQLHAAIALLMFKQPDRAWPTLDRLLRDPQAATRARTVEALGKSRASFDPAPLVQALQDSSAIVRRAACHAHAQARSDSAIQPLADRLSDIDSAVRAAAAQALQRFGSAATPSVLQALKSSDYPTQDAALEALTPDPVVLQPLHTFVQREIERLRWLGRIEPSIPDRGRITHFLLNLLAARAIACEQRLIAALGLLGDRSAMQQVGRGLRSHSADARAAAVEALDTLGDKQLVKQIIPLLEDAPAGEKLAIETALQECLESNDVWLRAVAVRVIAEMNVIELIPQLRALSAEANDLVRIAARDALHQMSEGEAMETLQTMSAMERVLLLHDVPLFAALSPDDLTQIANIAREQWYGDGSLICRQGDPGQEMYVLAQGQVRVTKQTSDGEKYLATRYAGDFIGEMSIVLATQRTSSVYAEGEVRTLVISAEALTTILHDRPDVALAMMRGVMQRYLEIESFLAPSPGVVQRRREKE
jgi:HEAT repeat protein